MNVDVGGLLQFVQRMAVWLERLATHAEQQATAVQHEFPAFAKACWEDAKDFRVMQQAAEVVLGDAAGRRITKVQLDTPIAELEGYGVDVRNIGIIENRLNILYVGQLLQLTPQELLNVKQLGPTGVQEIQDGVKLFLSGKPPPNTDIVWSDDDGE